jgi:fructose-1,6-bisphosphatase/inositol monophosphatase family enzyme
MRIYNLGGNPMMLKVAERTIDAVFEVVGQHPHDVVPGAYIARQAGAIVKDLQGNDLALKTRYFIQIAAK